MHVNNFPITLATSLVGLAGVNAIVPHIRSLGDVSILSDNDLAGKLVPHTPNTPLLIRVRRG